MSATVKRIKKSIFLTTALFLGFNTIPAAAEENQSMTPVKAWEEWSYSLALQAATWGAPLVAMYALRDNVAFGPHAKAQPNSIWRMEDISTPELSKEAGYVTPNVNVIYGFGFMDLRQEPIVVEVPDSNNRYYMVELVDMWTNAFAFIAGKETGYKGGKFVLVGPGWKGELPSGLQRIDCPTPWVLLQPRVHIYTNGKIDLPAAKKVLDAITTVGLSEFLGKPSPSIPTYRYPAPDPVNPNRPVSVMHYKDPLQFWELLMDGLNENPPPKDQLTALLPMFKPLGLEFGKSWDRTKVPPRIVKEMKEAAQKIGEILHNMALIGTNQGASIPPPTIGNSREDYSTRAIVARVGLTANTANEAVYWMYILDEHGQPLNGNKKYKMTFREEIPYYKPGFWSITLYDASNNYTVPNPINRYMLGSDTPTLKKNADGSFTIYIQNERPDEDLVSNWLPAPSGPFYMIPRAFSPKPETIRILSDSKSWPIPGVTSTEN